MDERVEEQQGGEIDLGKLLQAYFAKWWVIALTAIFVGAGVLGYTAKFVTPQYRASVMIYVSNYKNDTQMDYVSGTNLSTSQQLVSTYVSIIKSNAVLNRVIEKAHLQNISAAKLRSMMKVAQEGSTELFKVYVTCEDAKAAARIANAIADIAPTEIEEYIAGSSSRVIDPADVPSSKFSPDLTRSTIVGVLAGSVLALAYLTVQYFMDNRLKDEEDLAMVSDIPVLGQIPDFALFDVSSENAKRKAKERQYSLGKESKG